MIPVVISGGSGTRLWPVSRAQYPKQFCDLLDESLFLKTYRRLKPLGTPWILSLESMKTLTYRALSEAGEANPKCVFEPMAKNTLPALAYLAWTLEKKGLKNEVVGIFPADHLIEPQSAFLKTAETAQALAEKGEIVTIGIPPTYPATGYGYIETTTNEGDARRAVAFREKPDVVTATQFLQAGRFFWNAGVFFFKVSVFIEKIRQFQPMIWERLQLLNSDLANLSAVYETLPSLSVDYGIMEKLDSHLCVPADFTWNDIGSWDALAGVLQSSQDTSRIVDLGKDNFVFPVEAKTYSFVGVENLIVVDTQDALLVTKKGQSENVKDVYKKLEQVGSTTLKEHPFDLRPWGEFHVLKDSSDFKSKFLTVSPGLQLSLQSHERRSEHWVVIKGQGEVVLNDKVIPVTRGSYVFIEQGAKHRMRNTGSVPLEFVEVQLGDYFGEDDIKRYQDDFKRT